MAYATAPNRRWRGALAAGVVQAGLAVLVVRGLAAHYLAASDPPETTLTALPETRPTPEPPPPPPPDKKDSGEGAPPALKAEPRPQEAPKPRLVVAPPKPLPTQAGAGSAASSGLAQVPGSGSGAGGVGNGTGTGSGGNGSGAGARSPAVRVAGGISDRDYPREAAARGAAGTVAISFRVRTDGRVDGCRVIGSSGDAGLDGLTCALVERRFAYRPARGADGNPVESTLRTTFTWGTRGRY